nr:hypothetical protein CFP56_41467 [Quercus suber]
MLAATNLDSTVSGWSFWSARSAQDDQSIRTSICKEYVKDCVELNYPRHTSDGCKHYHRTLSCCLSIPQNFAFTPPARRYARLLYQ